MNLFVANLFELIFFFFFLQTTQFLSIIECWFILIYFILIIFYFYSIDFLTYIYFWKIITDGLPMD